jgi:restriction system protein
LPDLTGKLPENWKDFNKEFIPVFLKLNPGYKKIGAGLACGMTHTVTKALKREDVVISPNEPDSFIIGEIQDDYSFLRTILSFIDIKLIFNYSNNKIILK